MTVKELAERLNRLCQDEHGQNSQIVVRLEGNNDFVASSEVSWSYGLWAGKATLLITAKADFDIG